MEGGKNHYKTVLKCQYFNFNTKKWDPFSSNADNLEISVTVLLQSFPLQ